MTLTRYLVVMATPLAFALLAWRLLRIEPLLDTREVFATGLSRHARGRLVASLTRRGDCLRLAVLPPGFLAAERRYVGEQLVALDRIVGSVDAGPHPFDRHFDPTDRSAWSRFSSVFVARSDGLSLPPVVVYEHGEDYYLLDGHHRVAVARAWGDSHIRAEVAVTTG